MTTLGDRKLAATAAGFTLGFGFLTVWEAMKQTRRNKNPLRSMYIYMLWGEIAANLGIGILGWIYLEGTVGGSIPVLFMILFFWAFEIQLLMQIIVNRIAIISETQRTVRRVKYATIISITLIEMAVYVIWIPAHMSPPLETFVLINNYWDKTSKILILVVDATLNWFFLRSVQERLLNKYGLTKYAPLVSFNAKLMVVSILMDSLIVGMMFYPNPLVYIQFHPVAYMVKLNIEMSMASLITRLARGDAANDAHTDSVSNGAYRQRRETLRPQQQHRQSMQQPRGHDTIMSETEDDDVALESLQSTRPKMHISAGSSEVPDEQTDDQVFRGHGIHRRRSVEITVQHSPTESIDHHSQMPMRTPGSGRSKEGGQVTDFALDDELWLTKHAGHPRGV